MSGRALDAEELLPLIALALAHAVTDGRAPRLLAQLHLADCFLGAGAHTKLGYCLTTVQAAASFVSDQGG